MDAIAEGADIPQVLALGKILIEDAVRIRMREEMLSPSALQVKYQVSR
jgi:hypothetical protein